MNVGVNGTRLWFDVDGPACVPAGAAMRERPSVVLLHGGPGSYDHSYFKPHFTALTPVAQVVYLDLRGHGRSAPIDVAEWSLEACADDVAAFCDALGIVRPVVFGHSMGGFVAILYGARHPGHARGLVLQSTHARYDAARLVGGFRRFGGDEVAELARRDYGGTPVSVAEWRRVFAVFGPHVPDDDALARRVQNPALGARGMELFRRFDAIDQLRRITSPTLVSVGELDPVTPTDASREVLEGMAGGVARLDVVPGAGHFPWLDAAERYWRSLCGFVAEVSGPAPGPVTTDRRP